MLNQVFTLNNGKTLIVREVKDTDATKLAKVQNIIQDETNFLTFSTAEKVLTVDDIKEKISAYLTNKNNKYLVAIIGDEIVGHASLKQKSRHLRMEHRSEFSIGVLKEYWGLGIGRHLTECIIESAKEIGYEQIELIVVKDNSRAYHLYKTHGFIEEGCIKRSFKYPDGTYADGIMMVKFL